VHDSAPHHSVILGLSSCLDHLGSALCRASLPLRSATVWSSHITINSWCFALPGDETWPNPFKFTVHPRLTLHLRLAKIQRGWWENSTWWKSWADLGSSQWDVPQRRRWRVGQYQSGVQTSVTKAFWRCGRMSAPRGRRLRAARFFAPLSSHRRPIRPWSVDRGPWTVDLCRFRQGRRRPQPSAQQITWRLPVT